MRITSKLAVNKRKKLNKLLKEETMFKVHYLGSFYDDSTERTEIWRKLNIRFGNEKYFPTGSIFNKFYRTVRELPPGTIRDSVGDEKAFEHNDIISIIFDMMQAENWSPNGEKRGLIEALDLSHTSMSVGDIIEDVENEKFYMVEPIGFAAFNITEW